MRISQEPKRITSVIVIIKSGLLLKKLSYSRTKEEKKNPKIVSIRFSSPNVHTLGQQGESGRDVQELGCRYYGTNGRDSSICTGKTKTSSLSPLSAVSSNYEG